MYCNTMDLVGKVRGQGLVPDHGLVLEISGYLLFFIKGQEQACHGGTFDSFLL